ncbi:Hypothetical protein PAU_01026 [Photorhabdus asymbiotica]|uniref:Uncharacterized protein n=1 Tax=Photorhabdus asymbiotica subsp. asymbiotica (strain ATCC 43949 / 3105-77) TaxID=553480 RepID=B6VK60_PHOAA|nr:Hypothetical protein PAU_01026 [Photorhabdus asymbiotica]CAR66540.1 Hypothetical protein PA-RVA1-4459 [Photorhabdus asymbiotica subsp. asymbiotica ATCC 43949]
MDNLLNGFYVISITILQMNNLQSPNTRGYIEIFIQFYSKIIDATFSVL